MPISEDLRSLILRNAPTAEIREVALAQGMSAPLTGLIVQPIVGYLSDRTWTGLGRRRPYFME